MMPLISLSSVLLPEPFGPTRPTVVPEAISRSIPLSAQKSSLYRFERPKFTSRSLSDFSLRIMNRFERLSICITLADILQLLSEVALQSREGALTQPEKDKSDRKTNGETREQMRRERFAIAGYPERLLKAEYRLSDGVGSVYLLENATVQLLVYERPRIDRRRRPEDHHENH